MENELNCSNYPNDIEGNRNDALKTVEDAVNKLYEFHERYFENHSLEEAVSKLQAIKRVLEETLKTLEDNKKAALRCNRAKYYYNLGRAHNLLPTYSYEAEEALAKAVKLDPKLVPAWNELGECYWKRDCIQDAKTCFEKALLQCKNKVSLRNLSMLFRQEPCRSPEQKLLNVDKGVDYARQAVQMDTSDGSSWSILGNAYLAAFFAIEQNPRTLKQAMSSYVQAEKDPAAKNNPDLHYNKAVAHKYEEEYEEALISFTKAIERDPLWDGPKIKQQQLLKYLKSVRDMINEKGKLKPKKINILISGIERRHLGPYVSGMYTAAKRQSCKLSQVSLSHLTEGLNSEKVVMGKVICSIRDEDNVPFTFCLMDKEKTVVAVTIYNLAQGTGVIIGDSVVIPEPYLTHVSFTFNEEVIEFSSIRVDSPLVLVVNGKKLGRDKLASTQLSTFKMANI